MSTDRLMAIRRTLLLGSTALAAGTLAPWALPLARAQQGGVWVPTPAQTEGPFYPLTLPTDADFDLLRHGALNYTKGQPAWVTGTVTDTQGKALAGGVIEIWQCDHEGRYHHPGDGGRADPAFQGFGRVTLGKDGQFRFRTFKPSPYPGRTPHIHVKVKLGRQELLTTQFYVANDPGNARDGLWRRLGPAGQAALTRPFVPGAEGLLAQYPVVVQV